MHHWLSHLWKDEHGTLLVTDWVFIATILVLVIVPTVASLRDRVQQSQTVQSLFIGSAQSRAVLQTAAKP